MHIAEVLYVIEENSASSHTEHEPIVFSHEFFHLIVCAEEIRRLGNGVSVGIFIN
jgi:hypothetical protein